ncbi:hypothetical protein BaRGS_00012884, partial [Batillaria attramentaria]
NVMLLPCACMGKTVLRVCHFQRVPFNLVACARPLSRTWPCGGQPPEGGDESRLTRRYIQGQRTKTTTPLDKIEGARNWIKPVHCSA